MSIWGSGSVYVGRKILNIGRLNVSYDIVVCWFVVLGGAEASQSVFEHEYAEWVT